MARCTSAATTVESTPPLSAHRTRPVDLRADLGDGVVRKRGHGPVARAAAHVEREVPQDVAAVVGVRHLWMEQQREQAAVAMRHRRDGRIVARRERHEFSGHSGHRIAVAGPDPQRVWHAAKSAAPGPDRIRRISAWPHSRLGRLDPTAQHARHELHASRCPARALGPRATARSHRGARIEDAASPDGMMPTGDAQQSRLLACRTEDFREDGHSAAGARSAAYCDPKSRMTMVW
jgi:hypothetical protein